MLAQLIEVLFSPACLACHAPLAPRLGGEAARGGVWSLLCAECRPQIEILDPERGCPRCGAYPVARDDLKTTPGFCLECDALPRSFTGSCSAFPYRGPVGAMIRSMKYQRAPFLADHLVELADGVVGEWLTVEAPRCVLVPIPMPVLRELRRGYNQAREIAVAVQARYGGTVIDDDAFVRARWKGPQARHHTHAERMANLRGGFRVANPSAIHGRRAMVIDDVMTSGATASFAAEALMKAGASDVVLFSIVRASLAARDHAVEEVILG